VASDGNRNDYMLERRGCQESPVNRLLKHKKRLSDRYGEMELVEKAKKVDACGKKYSFYVCHECGQYCYLAEFRCDDRLCPLCGRHRVSRLLESYGGVLKGLKGLRMVTVSMRSRPLGQLKDAVRCLWRALSRLRHRAIWRKVRGAICSLEVTYNAADSSWHPHLHILVDSEFLVWEEFHRAWNEVTNFEGNAIWIQKARDGWEYELVKYITKIAELFKSLDAFKEFLGFAKGRRFIRTYGSLYNCVANAEEVRGPIHCKGCGAVMELEKQCVSVEDAYGIGGQELGQRYLQVDLNLTAGP
jgi:Replication protein